jgi:antitoxin (DNA-binding transcriptional repressor) of toxin-antitoxin stability system
MKSVGIKALKNNLSRYLDLVRQGEVILVTDRDEIIAELRLPSEFIPSRVSPWVTFLESQARRGALRLATRRRSLLQPPDHPLSSESGAEVLAQSREDRL